MGILPVLCATLWTLCKNCWFVTGQDFFLLFCASSLNMKIPLQSKVESVLLQVASQLLSVKE